MTEMDKLTFLIEAKMVEGLSFLEAINYRAIQLGCNDLFLKRILNKTKPITKSFAAEINELYQIREEALAKTARWKEANQHYPSLLAH